MSATTKDEILDAFGPILIKQGYEWVDLDEITQTISSETAEMKHAFSSKALICESWMERTDERAKLHHHELLSSGKPMREVLDTYFHELESFMSQYGFQGCPYTNTARAIQGKSEPAIQQRIKEHKNEVRSFFSKLCSQTGHHSGIVCEALFLIYSGATTESANMRNMKPVTAGRQAALALFDLYANQKVS